MFFVSIYVTSFDTARYYQSCGLPAYEGSDSSDSDDNGAVLPKVIYKAGDFVVVKFQAKKSVMVHYVAELMKMTTECDDKEWCVKFLRKQTPSSTLKFVYPQI